MDIAFVNLKPGTGKTTSAAWTAGALHAMDREPWLFDCDPAASSLAWSDRVAARSSDGTGFQFRIVGLPSREVHRRAHDYGGPGADRIYDTPQAEDHAAIVRSVMRIADHVILPVAPNPIEIDRMGPIRELVDDVDDLRDTPLRVSVLLNRTDTRDISRDTGRSANADYWADVLTAGGFHVLTTRIPAVKVYSQAFGEPISAKGTAYADLARELISLHEGEPAR